MHGKRWGDRYLHLAKEISTWSKDPSTKVGAVVIGDNGEVLSQGFNGFPRGIKDTSPRLKDREKKYKLVVHAEMNAIYNAGLNGVSLKGSTIICLWFALFVMNVLKVLFKLVLRRLLL